MNWLECKGKNLASITPKGLAGGSPAQSQLANCLLPLHSRDTSLEEIWKSISVPSLYDEQQNHEEFLSMFLIYLSESPVFNIMTIVFRLLVSNKKTSQLN